MIADNAGLRNGGPSHWLNGTELGGLTASGGPIGADFSSPGHILPSVICVAATLFRLVPGLIDAIHRSSEAQVGSVSSSRSAVQA
jgi:hypothetical protein